MTDFKISVIPGDGIGPEVCVEGIKVLNKIGEICGHSFTCSEYLAGGIAIDE
ncbi:MAG: 3-isopropylmalate dehydrogenase, partial [Planctomycetes bacterium]|nr:3-isopropylmalate dehydrogenase [Planctomycetota bacterium]